MGKANTPSLTLTGVLLPTGQRVTCPTADVVQHLSAGGVADGNAILRIYSANDQPAVRRGAAGGQQAGLPRFPL